MTRQRFRGDAQSPATRITQEIVARLEAGTKPWIKPWRGVPVSRPLRACGTPYRGMNVFSVAPRLMINLADLPATGRDIGFEAAPDLPKGKIALVGGRVVSMKRDAVIADGVVVVEGNRIIAVGPRGSTRVPADAKVVNVGGKTVMPGLVDVHWHGGFGREEVVPQRNWVMYASLGFGVTTVRDPSNDTSTVFAAAEMARAGLITAPRIFSTGTILYGAGGDFRAEINSLDDARFHLKKLKAVGAFSFRHA